MKSQTSLAVVACALACAVLACAVLACGTPLEKPQPSGSLRYRVRPAVAFEMLHDDETLPILDLRSQADFVGASGHLARAFNLPLPELEGRLTELSDLKHRTFLIYCGSDVDCGISALEILHANGYRAVVMDGGIEEWLSCGFGTVEHRAGCDKEVVDHDSATPFPRPAQ